MTLVIPRGQTAQPGPRGGQAGTPRRPSWGSAAAQLGLRGGPAGASRRPAGGRGGPIQEKPDGNRGPSGFRVTSRFEQSMQPRSVTRAAGTSPGRQSAAGAAGRHRGRLERHRVIKT